MRPQVVRWRDKGFVSRDRATAPLLGLSGCFGRVAANRHGPSIEHASPFEGHTSSPIPQRSTHLTKAAATRLFASVRPISPPWSCCLADCSSNLRASIYLQIELGTSDGAKVRGQISLRLQETAPLCLLLGLLGNRQWPWEFPLGTMTLGRHETRINLTWIFCAVLPAGERFRWPRWRISASAHVALAGMRITHWSRMTVLERGNDESRLFVCIRLRRGGLGERSDSRTRLAVHSTRMGGTSFCWDTQEPYIL